MPWTEEHESRVKVWFQYLKAAQRMNLPIKWSAYSAWGTPHEIAAWTFAKWWRERGRSIFERHDRRLRVESSGGTVVVTIPVSYTVRELRRELGPAVAPFLSKDARAKRGKHLRVGLVRYKHVAGYVRLLELDLDDKQGVVPLSDKITAFNARYEKEERRIVKQNAEIRRRAGAKKRFRKFKRPDNMLGTERVAKQWLRKARRIAQNVAGGTFPGVAYYKDK